MKKRKAAALFMAAAMVTGSLAGCGGNSGESQAAGSSGPDFADSGEPYNVIIENVTLGAEYKDTQAIEEAINAITQPEINCTVTIMNIGIADHANRMSMMIAGGEKLDLCMTGLTTNLVSMAQTECCVSWMTTWILWERILRRCLAMTWKREELAESCTVLLRIMLPERPAVLSIIKKWLMRQG